MSELEEFVKKIAKKANMQILTPEGIRRCSEDFLVCNLYAKSKFNEDALMNISAEKGTSGITGNVRIRAKTEGMAKCLGHRIADIAKQDNN